jgi:hypothetical protein
MLREAALPDAARAFAQPGRRAPFGERHRGREQRFRRVPPAGIIVIVRRQRPDAVQTGNTTRVSMLNGARAHDPYRLAQDVDFPDQQAAVPVQQVDREKVRPAWHAVTAIVRHGVMLPSLGAGWESPLARRRPWRKVASAGCTRPTRLR